MSNEQGTHDDNRVVAALAVSSTDATKTVRIQIDAATGKVLMESA